ncbi:MAG: helix-turn-helix transcriptional regulator [Eggerthellaceae bacterium]|nr:helix-turn-helix transcriptional regulator [Eggerthellaceae bacterium]
MIDDPLLSRALGANVKRFRAEQDLTKATLARMAGLCRPMLDRIEGGESNASLSDIQRIADALCIEPTDLLSSSGDKGKSHRLELRF